MEPPAEGRIVEAKIMADAAKAVEKRANKNREKNRKAKQNAANGRIESEVDATGDTDMQDADAVFDFTEDTEMQDVDAALDTTEIERMRRTLENDGTFTREELADMSGEAVEYWYREVENWRLGSEAGGTTDRDAANVWDAVAADDLDQIFGVWNEDNTWGPADWVAQNGWMREYE